MRRLLLSALVVAMGALVVTRVRAADPSELSVGGSYGEHSAHVTCGPDVRVRAANAGAVYHQMVPTTASGDHGVAIDFRGGVGRVSVAQIYEDPSVTSPRAAAAPRFLAGGQVMVGYDWPWFGFALGGGFFGRTEGVYAGDGTVYHALPSIAFRFGTRSRSFLGSTGLGAPPIPAAARTWGLFADFAGRTSAGIEIGGGIHLPIYDDLERTTGLYIRGGFPVAPKVKLDVMTGADLASSDTGHSGFGYRVGVGATFDLSAAR